MSDSCIHHIENHWKKLTVSSNELFREKRLKEALQGYENALYRAEVLNKHRKQCDRLDIPFLQVFIISCNNIAYTYEEMGRLDEAERFLKRAMYYVIILSEMENHKKSKLYPELKQTLLAYQFFAEKHNIEVGNIDKAIKDVMDRVSHS